MRQKLLLDTSLEAAEAVLQGLQNDAPMELIAINIQEAIDSLNQILGTHTKVDLLDEIFSRFCIGK
jgi:tRNA modification GTPase